MKLEKMILQKVVVDDKDPKYCSRGCIYNRWNENSSKHMARKCELYNRWLKEDSRDSERRFKRTRKCINDFGMPTNKENETERRCNGDCPHKIDDYDCYRYKGECHFKMR